MDTLSFTSKKRSVLWRLAFQIEQMVVSVGLVVYANLATINHPVSLFVVMIVSLTVGNLLIPLQYAGRRLYAARPFPDN
ncbi:MAG TPA: hypothetical protein VIH78_06435 [Terriglobales bacterium]